MYPICITSVPESQISVLLTLWPAVFELQAILKQMHWMTPKWPWTQQGHHHGYPICGLPVSRRPKFRSISLYDQLFQSYRPFWHKCTEWPQNDLEYYKVKGTPYICYYCPWFPNFSPFRSMTSYIQVTGHFEKSLSNDAKMTLNPTRSKVPHICVTSLPKFVFYNQPFLSYRSFSDKYTERLPNDLEYHKVKPHMCATKSQLVPNVTKVPASPKFHPVLLYNQLFSRYKVVNNQKCTKWHSQ